MMSDFFDMIKEGVEDCLQFEEGKINLRSKKLELPPPPKEYKARDVIRIRKNLNVSQAVLAAYLNVSTKTVQSWESGERNPSSSSLRLLEIFEHGFPLMDKNHSKRKSA